MYIKCDNEMWFVLILVPLSDSESAASSSDVDSVESAFATNKSITAVDAATNNGASSTASRERQLQCCTSDFRANHEDKAADHQPAGTCGRKNIRLNAMPFLF